jgi:hypothetical protein
VHQVLHQQGPPCLWPSPSACIAHAAINPANSPTRVPLLAVQGEFNTVVETAFHRTLGSKCAHWIKVSRP